MLNNVSKISIIGGSGTGKTTLSESLSKDVNIPVYHIDGIHHLENWKIRDKEETDRIIHNIIKKDKWIIDGTYTKTLEDRVKVSDLIIYLDYSTLAQVKGALGRFIKNHGKEKPEIPGCKEQMTFKFFMLVVKWRKNKRQFIIDALAKNSVHKLLVILDAVKL